MGFSLFTIRILVILASQLSTQWKERDYTVLHLLLLSTYIHFMGSGAWATLKSLIVMRCKGSKLNLTFASTYIYNSQDVKLFNVSCVSLIQEKKKDLCTTWTVSSLCFALKSGKCNFVNVICLPTEHQGVHKNLIRNVCAFQDQMWGRAQVN